MDNWREEAKRLNIPMYQRTKEDVVKDIKAVVEKPDGCWNCKYHISNRAMCCRYPKRTSVIVTYWCGEHEKH